MKKRRKFTERIIACVLAALMVVGAVPVDFVGLGAKEVNAADLTVKKEFILTADSDEAFNVQATNRETGVIGGYDAEAGNVKEITSDQVSTYADSFVFYTGATKSGLDSCNLTFGGVNYTHRFNTQGTMGYQKACIETTISETSTIEVIWTPSGSSNVASRKAKMCPVNGNSLDNEIVGTITKESGDELGDEAIAQGTNYKTIYTNVEPGTYQIGSASSGLYIFDIKVLSEAAQEPTDELQKMTVGAEAETCNFKESGQIFGVLTVEEDVVYSTNKFIKLEKGENTSLQTQSPNQNAGHGLKFSSDITFEVIVPANSVGTLSLMGCQWASCSAVKIVGSDSSDSVSLITTSCGAEVPFAYTNVTSSDIRMKVVASTGGTGYIHGVSYSVTEIPSEAYSVTVNLAEDYQLTGASDDELLYTFTNAGEQAFEYKPSELGNVKLSTGTYTLSLSGTALDKIPYDLADESKTVTVTEVGASINVALSRITEWYFGTNKNGFSSQIQNKTEYYKGLYVDASTGKLYGTGRADNAQFNNTTKISVPVDGPCTISVNAKNGTYTINGVGAKAGEFSYIYPGDSGVVDIVSTANNEYIYYIKVQSTDISPVTVSGNVTMNETLPDGVKLVFTNKADASQTYFADINNGSYSVKLPATASEAEFEISMDNSEYGVSGSNVVTVLAENNVQKDVTCYHKVARKVTLNLGSGPDLSDVTYRFTRKDDATVYDFTDKDNISLYDGTYRVTIEGEAFHKNQAYRITSDMELTVDGADTSHTITFEKAVSWKLSGVTGDTDDYYALELQNNIGYYNGLEINTASGKFFARLSSGDTQANPGTVIKVPVTGACTVTVTAKSAVYAPLVKVGDVQGTSASSAVSYEYTGESGYVTVNITTDTSDAATKQNSAYLSSISVVYSGDSTTDVAQEKMPSVPETDGQPKGNNASKLSVDAEGQKLKLTQTGGDFSTPADVSYYVFPLTADNNVLEYDAVVTEAVNKSAYGLFGGVFTKNYQYTVAMRSASTSVRALYSKSSSTFSSASGTDYGITIGTKVHYRITTADGKAVVTTTFVDKDGVSQVCELSQTMIEDGGEVYYGMALANANATITNMVYTSADGNTVYYNQNNAYRPAGSAPEPATITAVTATGTDTSSTINVSWTGDLPEQDGYYVLQVQIDNGEWITVAEDIMGYSYVYGLQPATTRTYKFRVYGKLGKPGLGGTTSGVTAITDSAMRVTGALATPVVTATADASAITLKWDKDSSATSYEIYRYSFDEGESKASKIQTQAGNVYVDSNVTAEMPYYYYVIAKSSTNSSAPSEVVWAMATPGHSGKYVYENDATEIYVTKKSYDTVFNGKAVLEGNVYGTGTLKAEIAGVEKATATISNAGDSFAFELDLEQGRNDVNLLFTDANGNVTRKTYNFVYLTGYNKLVDASYTGTDGAKNADGIPTYKTIQAAVNSVSADNASKVVILVAAGDYNERLVVDKPNVSIIGQDRESTLVHNNPGYVGDDMSKRCATYVQSSAANFSAENISFKNDYVYSTPDGKSNKSADALRVDADNAVFVNVKISSVQDTLYMDTGKQFYYKCRIEGLVDYIYSGNGARAFFDDCELVFVYESTKNSGYVCAPKTDENAAYGLTFYNCVITGEEGCNGTGYLLARPWGKDAYITWINCYMGKSVNATLPYSDMSGNAYQDARFFEYGTYGPGFAVNADRRQISPSKATAMVSDSYLGWAPYSTTIALSGNYKGSVTTTCVSDKYGESTRVDDKYLITDGDDTGLARYTGEGYSTVYGVTGGGLLKETSENYYKVSDAEGFLKALTSAKKSGKNSVIEITADINLGSNEVPNYSSYSDVIKPYSAQALTHPALISSGVSVLTLSNVYNLTIFSSNGSSIKHANITMKNSENIIIRNIKFDELWEWDEDTSGDYDRNDWDYMTIDSGANGVWIDHCTFYKAYDGVVDIKNPNPVTNVTISWCEFLPGSEGDTFFNQMMDTMAANPSAYPYYKSLLDSGMSQEQIWWYAYGQKKTHLLGQSVEATNAAGIRLTLANNYYKNSMDRMPRLRYGVAHVYNCILDAQDLYTARASITNAEAAKHIVSNGASSTCDGKLLMENSYINGIINALNSGNGSDPSGYINAINSLYYINGIRYKLEPKVNTTLAGQVVKKTNVSDFKSSLGYSYNLRDAATLSSTVAPYSGAGKMNFTVLQWEKSTYNDKYVSEGSTGSYDNTGLPSTPGSSDSGNTGDNGGNGSGSGSGSDSDDSDYDYDNDSDDDSYGDNSDNSSNSGASGSGSANTGSSDSEGYDVLNAADIPGANITQIDGTEFAEIGEISDGAADIIKSVDTEGKVASDTTVINTTANVTKSVLEKIDSEPGKEIVIYASQNASISASVMNELKESGKVLTIGVVDSNNKVNSIVTLDGNKLTGDAVDFTLKINVDVRNNTISNAASIAGISNNEIDIIDFNYSGKLPGVLKVAVNVANKFEDGKQLALFYYNSNKGTLENQYQITTVSNGFAEFAIDHCSEYVLVDVSAAEGTITTSALGSPKTADSNAIIFWLMLMCAAVLVLFGIQASRADGKKRA
ncbi:MAG: pectinesterase family protein [Lachnospira sp.]